MDFDDLRGISDGLHELQILSDHDSTEGDSSEGGSENSPAPPMFPRLIDFFEQAERDRGVSFPLKDWRDCLRCASEGADAAADAYRAIVSLLHGLEARWPDFDHRIPTEILLEGSRYGKPIA